MEKNLTYNCLYNWSTDVNETDLLLQYYTFMEVHADKVWKNQVSTKLQL